MIMRDSTPSTIKFTNGVPGAGKSYSRSVWLVTDFLSNESGDVYTNLPLNIDNICDYLEERGYDRDRIRERIKLIPTEQLAIWKKTNPDTGMPARNEKYNASLDVDSESKDYCEKQYQFQGPWLYFQDKDVSGAHIIFDEIQELVHTRSSKKLQTEWNDWLATIRHENCTIEFMTQMESRVPKAISGIAETRVEILPLRTQRIPILGIMNYDFYQVIKRVLDINMNGSFVQEFRCDMGGKKTKSGRPLKYRFKPKYFKFYDSFNKTTSKDKKGERKKEPWELHSSIGIVLWFFKRNLFQSLLGFAMAAGFLWLVAFNGVQKIILMTAQAQQESVEEIEAKRMV